MKKKSGELNRKIRHSKKKYNGLIDSQEKFVKESDRES